MKKAYCAKDEIKMETKLALLSLWEPPTEAGVQGLHPTVGFSMQGWGAWCQTRAVSLGSALAHFWQAHFWQAELQLPTSVSLLLNQSEQSLSWQEMEAARMIQATEGNLWGWYKKCPPNFCCLALCASPVCSLPFHCPKGCPQADQTFYVLTITEHCGNDIFVIDQVVPDHMSSSQEILPFRHIFTCLSLPGTTEEGLPPSVTVSHTAHIVDFVKKSQDLVTFC